ncbi:N-acetylglucosamine-specific PTS transporter subunit IIBC [Kineothrix sp. MB12-C1]|nr:N-acetylglucosamine-specific PTS transporter subunit IIBC [Kineothrix sp. MB12-C1]WMC94552.1 N-acetylglucosamine-specific PTS transporter subunit IIBC [Kineothrix sp. MB12-C1]
MKYLQRLGKSLMLPVACLPVAGIMLGLGYWIDPSGWGGNNVIAAFLCKAGSALIDNMALLFVIGVAVGMSDDNDGTSALAGIVSYLMIKTLLSPGAVEMFTGAEANVAFSKIDGNQFIGILTGLIGAGCYNKFKSTKLPDALSFFSGKRSVAIVTAGVTIVVSLILFFVWPIIYGALVAFGTAISSTGAVGVGLYGFFNRLLIPFGLHHALNSVFWFDAIGIADLYKFWGLGGYETSAAVIGETGQYMTGFFPVMMFGVPAGALAMYHTAKSNKKKVAAGLLGAAALCSFLTGVTEPFEFAFMFLSPVLYVIHALLTGIVCAITALLPVRAGFTFSGGFIDWVLCAKLPAAMNTWMILVIGAVVAVVYYIVFRFIIVKLDLKTPGREDDDAEADKKVVLSNDNFTEVATIVLEGIGGKENVTSLDNCITRLRFEVKDYTKVDEKKIKSAGVAGIMRPSKTSVQVIVGTKVQFVADEMKKML